MKKWLFIILVLILPMLPVYAAESLMVETTFKQTVIEQGKYNIDGKLYLPLGEVSEALGAITYTNNMKNAAFIISRDGDVVQHTVGNAIFNMNGKMVQMPYPSVYHEEHGILVPPEMIETVFVVSAKDTHIRKDMNTNYYNGLISDLLRYCLCGDFYPENFARYYAYYSANPGMDAGVAINSVNIGLDKKWYDDAVITRAPYSRQVLVNKINRLPDNFEAKNLVQVDSFYAKYGNTNYSLDAEAYYKYVQMHDAAAKEGISLKIVSAYRTEAYQRNLFNSYVRSGGYDYAEQYSAHAGYSEHQTGLAVDINDLRISFENTKEYEWLWNHAHEYGFIERYKKGREYITGYAYEPWHYRYVGENAAKIMRENNMTYEEYCAVYLYNSEYLLDKDRIWANVLPYYYK